MEQTQTNKPYAKLPISNGMEICFWLDEKNIDGKTVKMLKPSITKSWKKEDGSYENRSVGMNTNDLFRLVAMGGKIKEIEDRFKEERKSE